MKKYLLTSFTAILSISTNAHAITCSVMTYDDQLQLTMKEVTQDIQTIYEENGIRFKTVLQSDGRYTLVILKSGSNGLAAMGKQGSELTLTDADLNRTFACK